MVRVSVILASCLAIAGACQASGSDDPPVVRGDAHGSSPATVSERFLPIEAGPLELESVTTLDVRPRPVGGTVVDVSPDGERFMVYDTINGLGIRKVEADGEMTMLGERLSTAGFGYADTLPFAWEDGSDAILGVRQDVVLPSGFAKSPKRTVRIALDGTTEDLPALTHPAGPLDGILWLGGEGKALAEFGTKGGYYRPERASPNPTIAMVDAAHGKVLQAVPVPNLLKNSLGTRVASLAADLDRNGDIRVLFAAHSDIGPVWYFWRQGHQPERLAVNPGKQARTHYVLVPERDEALFMHGLSASGMICEHNPNCPPPTPKTGTIADLRDLETGAVIWSIEGTADGFSTTLTPVISPDGEYALITIPGKKGGPAMGRDTIALIAMRDGSVIQHIAPVTTSSTLIAFSKDGKSVSIAAHSNVAVYRFAR